LSDANTEGLHHEGEWAYLRRELFRRTRDPIGDPNFVFYVFLAIVLFGGLGIWVELLKYSITNQSQTLEGTITAIITFFPSLVGAATLQLVLSSMNKQDKTMATFGLVALCTFMVFALLLPFFSASHPLRVLTLGAICSLAAVWTWWITNGSDPTFRKLPRPDAATGGTTERSLAGNLDGFKV